MYALWRLIEARKGLIINVRDDHIDEAELMGDPEDSDEEEVEVKQMNKFQTIEEIIGSIERKHGKLETIGEEEEDGQQNEPKSSPKGEIKKGDKRNRWGFPKRK